MKGNDTKKTLLLVEDETILAMTEKMTLEKFGYAVIIANCGEKAVETVARNPAIDLVLMDIDLGKGMDGTQAGAEILSRHDIPIVFLSSHTESEIVEKTEKITSYGYVVKNSSITVLDASIKMAFKLFYANKKTEESEYKYKFLADNIPDILYSLDREGKIDSINAQSFAKYGYMESDVTGKTFMDFIHPEDREILMKSFMSCMQERRVNTSGLQFRLTAANGAEIWIELNANARFDESGGYLGEEGVLRDITERKYAEEKLRQISDNMEEVFWLRSAENSELLYISPSYEQVWGRTCESLYENRQTYIDSIFDEDKEAVSSHYEQYWKGGRFDLEFRIVRPDDTVRWVRTRAFPVRNVAGEVIRHTGIATDITERKLAEIALQTKNEELRLTVKTLRESEERFQMLFDNAPLGYQSLDFDGNFIEVNQQWLDTLGYDREEVIGKWFGDFLSPAYRDGFRMRFPLFKAQGHIHSEFEMIHKKGNRLFIAFDGRIGHEPNGDFKQTHCILQDITERRNEEQRLKLVQERHVFALEGSELGEWDWNLKTGEMTRNEQWAKTLGYTLSEIANTIGQGIDLQHPDDREKAWNAIQDHLGGRTDSFNIMYRMRAKDGTYKWIHDCGKIMQRDEEGNPARVCGTHANIDEQIKARDSLQKSNALLTSIIESSPEIIVFALDTGYNYLAFNTKHTEVIAQIWGKTIEIGMNMLDVIGNHSDRIKAKSNFDRALAGEHFVLLEEYGDEALSRVSWVDYWSPIRDLHGAVTGLTCFVLNNTVQKTAELKIKNLLDEKELLLREVHHRIKNNMTTISGLLVLQAETAVNPLLRDSLREAGDRVMSMQILYDKLYRSSDVHQLGLASYLDPLTDEILSHFRDGNRWEITKRFDDVILDASILQPLGIIMNELLTNTMKYAFIGRTEGKISISATLEESRITFTVADNGNGMSESVDFNNSTGFGLVLVNGLTQQLGGTIRIERGQGTRIVLEFER